MLGSIVRFGMSAFMLLLLGYLVPGFSRLSPVQALLGAAVIALLGFLLESVAGHNMYGRGVAGFASTAAVIYLAQFLVPGMHVTVLGALLAALFVGVVDLFVPTEFSPRPSRSPR